MAADRHYPPRPVLAVSAAIVRAGRILLARRARAPAQGLYTLPGGGVETGETLHQAVRREVREETALEIEIVGFAGLREVIQRDPDNAVRAHFVVLAFAARADHGAPVASEELADLRWVDLAEAARLPTTEGLLAILATARQLTGV